MKSRQFLTVCGLSMNGINDRMIIKYKKLGPIKEADLEIGDMTVICGGNNTGKTYLSYSIFGLFKLWEQLADFSIGNEYIDELSEKGFIRIDLKKFEQKTDKVISAIFKKYSENIQFVFSSQEDEFSDLVIQGNIDKIAVDYSDGIESMYGTKKNRIIQIRKEADSTLLEITILSKNLNDIPPISFLESVINISLTEFFFKNLPNPFLIPAERSGIALFYKELDIHKNVLLEQLTRYERSTDFNPFDMMGKVMARYPLPIKEHIDFIRDLEQIKKQKSSLIQSKYPKGIESILEGSFKIHKEEVVFYAKNPKDKRRRTPVPLYLSSSAAKSLLGLDVYLKHAASEGDLLLIDEPELNLHPDNQRKIARLLATLVNRKIKVLITTHSDYIVKELGNLVMLSNNFKGKKSILRKYKYKKEQFLSPSQLKVYIANNGTIENVYVDSKSGIEIETFDKVINEMNSSSEDIYFSINAE